jgi:hypothetical protein
VPEFLQEEPSKTVFVGDVIEITDERGQITGYDVQNGGWNWMGPDAPDTWLTEHVLKRFKDQRVRVTVEALGPTQDYLPPRRSVQFGDAPES